MWPHGVVRIRVTSTGGDELSLGTGALARDGLVLTALHVVRKKHKGKWGEWYRGSIDCSFDPNEQPLAAAVVDRAWDEDYDFVWLQCAAPRWARTIDLSEEEVIIGNEWHTYGFPQLEGSYGEPLLGKIIGPQAELNATLINLSCPQRSSAALMDPVMSEQERRRWQMGGLSGAPCIIDKPVPRMVGVIIAQQDDGKPDVLSMSPISEMCKRPGWIKPPPPPPPPPPPLPQRLTFPGKAIHSLAWSGDDVIVVGLDSEVRLVDVRHGDSQATVIKVDGIAWQLKAMGSRRSPTVVLHGGDRLTMILGITAREIVMPAPVYSLDVAGACFVVGGEKGTLHWIAPDGSTVSRQPYSYTAKIRVIAGADSGGAWSAAIDVYGRWWLSYDTPDEPRGNETKLPDSTSRVRAIVPVDDGTTQAIVITESFIARFDRTAPTPLHILGAPPKGRWKILMRDRDRCLILDGDGALWEPSGDGIVLSPLARTRSAAWDGVDAVALTPNRRAIAIGSGKVLDLEPI